MSVKETLKAISYSVGNVIKKPVTKMYPDVPMPISKRSRGMLSLDLDDCIGCELCYKICPADAIRMQKLDVHFAHNARDEAPTIDFNKCIFCGLCSEICPPQVLHHTHKYDISTKNRAELMFSPFQLKDVFLELVAKNPEEYEKHETAKIADAKQAPLSANPQPPAQTQGENKTS